MKISLYTLGCTVNSYETQKIRQLFIENGYQVVENETPDIIVINSCAVTSLAGKSSVQLLRRLRKKNPQAVIALVGCYSISLKQNDKIALSEADIILGNDKLDIVNQVNKLINNGYKVRTEIMSPSGSFVPRAFLQIQNGCDNSCSYCIVPHFRGKPVSKPLDDIMKELRSLISQGYREIVIAGINLALYNHMQHTLIDVLIEVNALKGLELIRLSSLEPIALTGYFINKLPEITKLCPHLHISLQSGSNKILSSMKRKYTFEDYLSKITKLRDSIQNVAVSTDVIVGFPGESDEDFLDSCHNIVRCEFSDIHIFKYSKRDGTAAAMIPEQVTEHKKSARTGLLQGIKLQTRYNYARRFIGKTERVLPLKKHAAYLWEGISSHNIKVMINANNVNEAGISDVIITGIHEDGEYLTGRLNLQ